jgi:hypothetical protein
MLKVLREKALKGDARALERLIALASVHNNETGETAAQALPADDQAILDAYVDEIRSTGSVISGSDAGYASSNHPTNAAEIVRTSIPSRSGGA